MKRSEMLSKIASVIINYNEAYCVINRDKAMEMAETILQIQEKFGMIPPFSPPEKLSVMQDEEKYTQYYKWESEDSTINTEKAINEMLKKLDNDKETKDILTKLVPDGVKLK